MFKSKKKRAREALVAEALRSLPVSDGPVMASFSSWQAPRLGEPSLASEKHIAAQNYLSAAEACQGLYEPSLASEKHIAERAAQNYLSAAEARQGLYATGSGTLTQFNAIMAAIHGSVIASGAQGLLKASSATALLLHVLAAFILCWAARPVEEKRHDAPGMALVDTYRNTADTFRNYRRGWRMTLLALTVSSVVAALFVLHAFDIALPAP